MATVILIAPGIITAAIKFLEAETIKQDRL